MKPANDNPLEVRPPAPAVPLAPRPGSAAGGWCTWLCAALVVLAFAWMCHRDAGQVRWAVELSSQGSPPPAADSDSVSGYAGGKRAFLGTVERGETYRWIAATQAWMASGSLPAVYTQDNAPMGRHDLSPRLYLAWLAGLGSVLHLAFDVPPAAAVEQAALWEPVVVHALFFLLAAGVAWWRLGALAGLLTAVVVAFLPPLSAQFIPGALGPRTGSWLLAAAAIVLELSVAAERSRARYVGAALLASSLWLDPAFGFPAILACALINAAARTNPACARQALVASLFGAALSLLAWRLDGAVTDTAAGELRFIHPLYSAAWAGLGFLAHGWHSLRSGTTPWKRLLPGFSLGVLLGAPLLYSQISHRYPGWLFSSAPLRRLTSQDEGRLPNHLLDWLSGAPALEVVCGLLLPVLAVCLLTVAHFSPRPARNGFVPPALLWTALGSVLLISLVHVRWLIPASLVGLAVIARVPSGPAVVRLRAFLLSGVLVLCLFGAAGAPLLPPSFQRKAEPTAPDIEALVHRHLAHWLSSHAAGERLLVLAPPELSDSLVFHGNLPVLLSSAWQSYPGHLAASRILSAPEWSEAQAVLESRRITHLVLPSWDPVLPLLVQPAPEGRDTAYARLQRWMLPLYLRPIPYHLPNTPGYEDQKLVVLQVTDPQDEALALSRLAEYFVEMKRPEPARLVADVLAGTFPDDRNAAVARALVANDSGDTAAFARVLSLVAAPLGDDVSLGWDRRVQRAIALALGRRTAQARGELEACAADGSREGILALTPLQAHRLRVLMERLGLSFTDPGLTPLLQLQGSEYANQPGQKSD